MKIRYSIGINSKTAIRTFVLKCVEIDRMIEYN